MRAPLFTYGLFFFLGHTLALAFHWALLIPCLFLYKKKWCTVTFLLGITLALSRSPNFLREATPVEGNFTLQSIERISSPFNTAIALKGKLDGLPCSTIVNSVPQGNHWQITGTLRENRLKVHSWEELPNRTNLTRWRFETKDTLRRLFFRRIPDKKVAALFASLATGQIASRQLLLEFRKVGLSHFLAISGLHFAFLALFIGGCLRLFLKRDYADLTLLFFLTLYFIYMGPSPSILRAYIMIALYILSRLLYKPYSGLNALGLALIIELLIHPLATFQIGFGLTYLATAGIFLFFRPIRDALKRSRNYLELKELSTLDKHLVLLLAFFRANFALSLAVLLATLPLVLFTFHTYPILSLPYNLLLGPLLLPTLLLAPLSLAAPFFTPLATRYTAFTLDLISRIPEPLNLHLSCAISLPILVLWLSILLAPNKDFLTR